MSSLTIRNFAGMLPRYGEEAIPPNAATEAVNCRLLAGELQSLKVPTPLENFTGFTGTIKRVFRVQTALDTGFFACFTDETVDFVKAPITKDAYNRHYWTTTANGGYPRYAPESVLQTAYTNAIAPVGYKLGIPRPGNALTVNITPAAPPPTTPIEDTRVYTYTYVSAYGEEGQPAETTTVTGDIADTYTLSNFDHTITDSAERNITAINVYRTITGTLGATDYFLVTTIAFTPNVAVTPYDDTASANTLALKDTLPSETWAEPPVGLTGLVVHPNGFMAGFKGRDLFLSVPYRPHAWPVEYVISTKWNIVGLGITGQSIIILTEGSAYVAGGVRPESLTQVESDEPIPCLSHRGIVSTDVGVLYPGPDGLMQCRGDGSITNLTKKIVSRREWRNLYYPYLQVAAKHDTQYIAFYNSTQGFAIDFGEPSQAFVLMDSPNWAHTSFQGDPVSGDVWLINGTLVSIWNPEYGAPVPYRWRSKEFDFPTPINFGAVQITYSDARSGGVATPDERDAQLAWNTIRITKPLNPLNFSVLGMVRYMDPDILPTLTALGLPENRQPYHQSPLFRTSIVEVGAYLNFKAFINREQEPVYSTTIEDMELYRPPTGFRSILWHFELEGTADVQSLKIASTSKELGNI